WVCHQLLSSSIIDESGRGRVRRHCPPSDGLRRRLCLPAMMGCCRCSSSVSCYPPLADAPCLLVVVLFAIRIWKGDGSSSPLLTTGEEREGRGRYDCRPLLAWEAIVTTVCSPRLAAPAVGLAGEDDRTGSHGCRL
ncbi:hypothetical protein ACLOJK_035168, partial [Asimina triloba]